MCVKEDDKVICQVVKGIVHSELPQHSNTTIAEYHILLYIYL